MADGPDVRGPDADGTPERDAADATGGPDSGFVAVVGSDPLVALAAGTFHAALLVVALVAVVHAAGALGDVLGGFGTLPGAGVFVVLWAVSWWTTRRGLGTAVRRGGGVPAALVAGVTWGAAAGVAFLLAVAGVGGLVVVLVAPAEVLAVALLVGVGAVVAAIVGSVVGGLVALLDVALLAVAVQVVGPEV